LKKRSLVLFLLLAGTLSACSATAPSVPTPTVTPPAASPVASATLPLTSATPSATASDSQRATPTSSPTSAPAASDALRFDLVKEGSQARFRVREQLVERSFPSDAVGSTDAISGSITLTPDGQVVRDQSKFTVDLRGLKSDSSRRDRFIQGNTLETERFPTAEFIPSAVTGLARPLPTSGQASFKVAGDLTIHGVTKPVTWDVTAQVNGREVTGQATTRVTFEDFGMSPPRVAVVLSVEDNIQLEVDFHLIRAV